MKKMYHFVSFNIGTKSSFFCKTKYFLKYLETINIITTWIQPNYNIIVWILISIGTWNVDFVVVEI